MSDNRTKQQIFELVQCALWSRELNLSLFDDGVDWSNLLTTAKQQTLLSLITPTIETLPASVAPNRESRLRLHLQLVRNRQIYKYQRNVLAELYNELVNSGVKEPILLKGISVADNYPEPDLRACGDIDLYVGLENFAATCRALAEIVGDDKSAHFDDLHYTTTYKNTPIELHDRATIFAIKDVNQKFQEYTRQSLDDRSKRKSIDVEGRAIAVPPTEFNAIYIFAHLYRHFMRGGIGLRQLCDWAMYLSRYHSEIDIEDLESQLNKLRLLKAWQKFGYIVVNYLGLSENKFPLYKSNYERGAKRIVTLIFEEGNFGHYRKGKRKGGKIKSMCQILERYFEIAHCDPKEATLLLVENITTGLRIAFGGKAKQHEHRC